jgi:hypothetical protein
MFMTQVLQPASDNPARHRVRLSDSVTGRTGIAGGPIAGCASLPMAAAFDRAGYLDYGIRLVLPAIGE